MDEIIETARTSGRDAALAKLQSNGEIEPQLDQMLDTEQFSVAHWQTLLDELQQSTIGVIAVAVVIATIFAAVAWALAWLEVTRRRKATEENIRLYRDVQEREVKIGRLVDSNIIGIVFSDFEGPIIEANDAFLDILGYTREDLVSGRMAWAKMAPAEWRAVTQLAVAELRATGRCKPFEKEYFRKDGSRVPVLVGAAAFERSRNDCVAFVLDLTERKRMEAALRRSDASLADAQQISHTGSWRWNIGTGELAWSAEHFRIFAFDPATTPSYAGFLEREQPDLDEVRHAVLRIVREAQRAGGVIRGLRGLAKKSGPDLATLDINDAIREVLALTRSELLRHRVVLRTDLCADDWPVFGDRVQLQQVLLNLITNGVDAMSTVTDRPKVLAITSEPIEAGGMLVAVEDTGTGLDPATADRIFDPFFTTKPSGMGMGFSICRSLIAAHGGRFWVSPSVPCGTLFRLTLPTAPSRLDFAD